RPAAALPVVQVDTTVFLLGAGQSHFSIPAFTFPPEAPTEADLVWGGLQGDIAVDTQGRHITGVLQAHGFTWAGGDTKCALHNLVAQTDIVTQSRSASRSDTSIRVGSVALTPRAEAHVAWAVTGGAIHATTATTGRTLQAMTELHIETLRLAEASYGPG